MNYFYCKKCTEAPPPALYEKPIIAGVPLRTSTESAPPLTVEMIRKARDFFSSPKMKGEMCARCEIPFLSDQPRFVMESLYITPEDIANRVIFKYEWSRAVTLEEQNRCKDRKK